MTVVGVLLVLVGAGGLAVRQQRGNQQLRSFERGYAAAVAHQQDPGLTGRVEYAARRGPEGLADLYRDLRASTDRTRAALARLQAPDDVKADVARLTRLLEQQSDALRRLTAAMTSPDRGALAGATRELARTAAQTSALRSRIEQRLAGAQTS
jgi:hypothetical protein